ncbi:MAG: ATP-grasp domain-containing protein [Candidatus Aenigmatarchaeota archaeon]
MKRLRIGIVFDSGEFSCKSSYDSISDKGVMEEVAAVKKSLENLGYMAILIPIGRGISKKYVKKIQSEAIRKKVISKLRSELRKAKTDLVFNLCETFFGDPKLQSIIPRILDEMKIPYTGSPWHSIEMTTDKSLTKKVLEERGIPTPRFKIFFPGDEISAFGLRFPLIVKPNFEDGSVGIEKDSVVYGQEELVKKVLEVMKKYDQPVLVEEYIDGRELNVAVFINNGSSEVLPISEIVFNYPDDVPKITSYSAKWIENSEEYKKSVGICPCELPIELEEKIKMIASECVKASGCRDYARVDIRLDRNNQPYVIEVNANPDISPKAGFMRSFLASGRSYEDFVRGLVKFTLQRKSN